MLMTSLASSGSFDSWYGWLLLAVFVPIAIAASRWRFFLQWLRGVRGKNWPAMSATIEIVSVTEQVHQSRYGSYSDYLATLTFFYKNPDLQSGDYSRLFSEKTEAESWANSFKNSTVTVHIDPKDPANSVLEEGDLNKAT